MGPGFTRLLAACAIAAALTVAGCSGSSASSGTGSSGGSSTAASQPASTAPEPAIGTSKSGELFPRYTNSAAGFSIAVPGGWKAHQVGKNVRFGRLGDVLLVQIKHRKHPMTLDAANMVLHNLATAGTASEGKSAEQLIAWQR